MENYGRQIGTWGEMHRRYLKNHRNGIYMGLLLKDTLWDYLAEVDEQAEIMMEVLIRQMKEAEDVTEELKARDQMAWVRQMNSIHDRAREIVLRDLIYN